ncbi:hypothetical protein GF325_17670 [Candidatus Bathyarchaeota archaeon]|nr:hypothetical protein [Candidatus Bathyarchaeota archaeon]
MSREQDSSGMKGKAKVGRYMAALSRVGPVITGLSPQEPPGCYQPRTPGMHPHLSCGLLHVSPCR